MKVTNDYNMQYVNYTKVRDVNKTENDFHDELREKTFEVAKTQSQPQPVTLNLGSGNYYISYEHLPAVNVEYQRNLTKIMRGSITCEILPFPEKIDSIYDIPYYEIESRLEQAVQVCASFDKTGMTKAEIYNRIDSIFMDYLGNNFKEPALLDLNALAGTSHAISQVFGSVLRSQGVHSDSLSELHQIYIDAWGYTGMSKDEMRAAVRSKYPEVMTLRDCIFMDYEIGKLGLENTSYTAFYKDRLFGAIGATRTADSYWPDVQRKMHEIYESMLDMPADYNEMKAYAETFRNNEGRIFTISRADATFEDLLMILISVIGGDGWYSDNMIEKLKELLQELKDTELFNI